MSRRPTPRALPTRSQAGGGVDPAGRADPFGRPDTWADTRRELPLDEIAPNRGQPRKHFNAAALERLRALGDPADQRVVCQVLHRHADLVTEAFERRQWIL